MIRKLSAILLALVMVLSLTACDLNDVLSQVEEVLGNLETSQTETGESSGETGDESKPDESGTGETGKGEEPSDGSDENSFFGLYGTWHELIGYWITDDQVYAVLDMADSHTGVFYYGWWETEFQSEEGIVAELTASGDEEMTATLTDGGVIVIDYSGFESDGTIRIKIGDQDQTQFTLGGGNAEEAYQAYCNNRNGS